MTLNNIIHTAKRRVLAAILPVAGVAATLSLCSCDDFLTIQPLNEIVHENFWQEEADVNSSLNACYALMESPDFMHRVMVWGELRSDNIEAGSGVSNDIQQILKENLLETNGFTKWDAIYKVINQCNTMMYYAPSVAALDPNFTESELRATIAEATTLRSLCYFYLIRTFRDVPYVTQPSIDDDQPYVVPADKFEAVLDSIIRDVELVKNDAVRSYGEDAEENTTRITRWACYALLADMYLWKGEYQKCIDNCDLIIQRKIDEYEREKEENPNGLTIELYGNYYPLISEVLSGNADGGTAYNEIFGEGHSFESIFELNFERNQNQTNTAISDYYGSSSSEAGQWAVPSYFTEGIDNNTNEYFRKTDDRIVENINITSSKNYISKYVYDNVNFRVSANPASLPKVNGSRRSSADANWIVYRLTDVMLMRAEAEVELAGDVTTDQQLTEEQESHYRSAWSSIMAVWRRANNMRTASRDTLIYTDYSGSRTSMENLVMSERQRELMFEGKRWFDLVRQCRRDGDNSRMVSKVLPKFKQDQSSIRIRLSAQDALYYPYNREEMKVNKFLIQNSAYKTGENFELN